MNRIDGRVSDQVREITITPHIYEYAAGSVLFSLGKTKVLCAVTLAEGVPPFLRGKGSGWLTAEYAMLPVATVARSPRDSTICKRNGRSIEIARMIGRCMRCVTALEALGERTIMIDCDVLQADGSTRCAALCGVQIALDMAVGQWLETGIITQSIIEKRLAAVSVGLLGGEPLLDLSAHEDNQIDTDFNFVLTHDGDIIEIQGTAEAVPVTWEQFDRLRHLALTGTQHIVQTIKQLV